jgi:hypothetical protein
MKIKICKFYSGLVRGCSHRFNKDFRSRKKYKSHPKRCQKKFCPFGEEYYENAKREEIRFTATKPIRLTIRTTEKIKRWIDENKVSPQKVFDRALEELYLKSISDIEGV